MSSEKEANFVQMTDGVFLYLGSRKAMAEHDNIVRPRVVQQPHEVLPVLVRHQHSLFRSGCSETEPRGFNNPEAGRNISGKNKFRATGGNIRSGKRGAHGDWAHLGTS